MEFIPERGTVFIDAGSTTVCVAKHLNLMSGLTIITNSILAATKLSDAHNRIMVLGGILRGDILGTHGAWAAMALRSILIDVALLDSSGVKGFDGLVVNDLNDVEFKRAVMERSKTKIVLADSSKLHISFRYHFLLRLGRHERPHYQRRRRSEEAREDPETDQDYLRLKRHIQIHRLRRHQATNPDRRLGLTAVGNGPDDHIVHKNPLIKRANPPVTRHPPYPADAAVTCRPCGPFRHWPGFKSHTFHGTIRGHLLFPRRTSNA